MKRRGFLSACATAVTVGCLDTDDMSEREEQQLDSEGEYKDPFNEDMNDNDRDEIDEWDEGTERFRDRGELGGNSSNDKDACFDGNGTPVSCDEVFEEETEQVVDGYDDENESVTGNENGGYTYNISG